MAALLGSHLALRDSNLTACSAQTGGAVALASYSSAALAGLRVSGCTAARYGGAAQLQDGSAAAIVRCSVTACSAGLLGGGLHALRGSTVALNGTWFRGTSSSLQGACLNCTPPSPPRLPFPPAARCLGPPAGQRAAPPFCEATALAPE